MLNKLYSNINFLQKALNGLSLRHEAISNNIANVNTPDYKKVEVEFEKHLKDSLDEKSVQLITTNNKHISNPLRNFSPLIKRDKSTSTRKDGNNVNIDVEMANLAKNTIMYNAIIRQVSDEFNKIKTVLREGGK
ncbi:flagellar basal body rod protein FlgB [Thermohalobacter berrensis]|uniref:Flagellar basal body rod protein FlgB n=1 Tax=Thermohalobacter berrensis TaxID=99594 RepID=A0A419TAB8_9FIRM|nr:flagellar basal body rod protein FlgB [Thermohalobacter berrensis]RKD34429.1 flagellar basal-body rod protein FlgB [Thermohalobacter berrensis]